MLQALLLSRWYSHWVIMSSLGISEERKSIVFPALTSIHRSNQIEDYLHYPENPSWFQATVNHEHPTFDSFATTEVHERRVNPLLNPTEHISGMNGNAMIGKTLASPRATPCLLNFGHRNAVWAVDCSVIRKNRQSEPLSPILALLRQISVNSIPQGQSLIYTLPHASLSPEL